MTEIKQEHNVIAKELDYSVKKSTHPTYRFARILADTGNQNVTLSNSGYTTTQFTLPTNVFNFARSVLKFTVNFPAAGTNNFPFFPQDIIAPISGIEIATRSNVYMMQVSEGMPYWINISRKVDTKLEDFLTHEPEDGLSRSNLPQDNNLNKTYIGGSPNLGYTEPIYVRQEAKNATSTQHYEVRLDAFKDTIAALDKDVVFPEVIYLRVIWNQVSRMGWTTLVQYDPNDTPVAWASGTNTTISNLTLFLAIEQNMEIAAKLVEHMKSKDGYNILIPWVSRNKSTLTGSTHSLQARLNSGNGMTLLKAVHIPYGPEEKNEFYVCNNSAAAKVASLYTTLNGRRLQEFDVDCKDNVDNDYMLVKKKLKGSVIQSKSQYKHKWFYADYFDSNASISDEKFVDDSNLITGLSLKEEIKYDLFANIGSSKTAETFNWWSFFVTQRLLKVADGVVTVR